MSAVKPNAGHVDDRRGGEDRTVSTLSSWLRFAISMLLPGVTVLVGRVDVDILVPNGAGTGAAFGKA